MFFRSQTKSVCDGRSGMEGGSPRAFNSARVHSGQRDAPLPVVTGRNRSGIAGSALARAGFDFAKPHAGVAVAVQQGEYA